MFRGLYAAATALDAAAQAQEVTSQNLAHATTPGYRQRGATFETFDRVLGRAVEPTGDIVGTRLAGTYSDFRAGANQPTGNPLDVALADPDQLFALADPNGRPLYTRNGSFRLNGQNQIVSTSGYPLQGEGGPIAVPPGTAQIGIASDGSVSADGTPIGRIRTVRLTDPKQLTPVGDTLFTTPPDGRGVLPGDTRVIQGYKEGSNVNPAEAMTGMVIAARYYDAAQRALRTIAESVQLNTRPNG